MFMLLPNGHFLALPPEFWPHWYFWDCACAARMFHGDLLLSRATRSRRLRGSGAQRRGRWWRERSKAATRSSNRDFAAQNNRTVQRSFVCFRRLRTWRRTRCGRQWATSGLMQCSEPGISANHSFLTTLCRGRLRHTGRGFQDATPRVHRGAWERCGVAARGTGAAGGGAGDRVSQPPIR